VSNVSDKTHLVDAKTTAATVAWSKEVVVSANRELERHELWLERHHEIYSEALKECQRQLKRQYLISACKQTTLLPIQLLASGCVALFRGVRAYPRRSRLRAELQNRIDRMEQRRRFVQQAPWRNAASISTRITREPAHHSCRNHLARTLDG
jgi:hypothetical protein